MKDHPRLRDSGRTTLGLFYKQDDLFVGVRGTVANPLTPFTLASVGLYLPSSTWPLRNRTGVILWKLLELSLKI